MRRALTYFLTAIFLIALITYVITFTVRFTDTAVVTTFGKADESSVYKTAGLRFKLPYPIQTVTIYDKRVRVLQNKFEQLATKDSRQVAVETFCIWRVDDPLKFFQTFSNAGPRAEEHYRKAEDALRQNLRAAAALVSQYNMDELFSAGRAGSKLPELQAKMLDVFKGSADQSGAKLADYGVAAEDLGLMRIVLTEEVSKAVMERMKSSRDIIVKSTQSQGQATADSIRSQAESDANRIKQFADRLAQNIRSQGEREAVQYYSQMKENPQLAQFNSAMDFIREVYPKKTTLVLSADMPGVWMLYPDATKHMQTSEIPGLTRPKASPEDAKAEKTDDEGTKKVSREDRR